MKKNISINISGIIFHIEEDGYDKLKNYLDSINRYFGTFDDSHEIIADIEGRIAEIFLSKLKDGKQVISRDDVDSLVATMGSVKDFQAIEEDTSYIEEEPATKKQQKSKKRGTTSEKTESSYAEPRRVYRDGRRKILGGVLSGLAHYFSIDPLWIRLLYLLLFFGISASDAIGPILFIFYIAMWIIFPISYELEEEEKLKKMFRDPDQKVLGGVCSGIAAYFGIDVVIIRLLFFLSIFFVGTGIILYIILWIILPEAITITDKMKMTGQPVTLSNIESNIKKSFNVKEGEETVFVKILLFPFRMIAVVFDFLNKSLGPLLAFLVDALRIIVGILLVIIGISLVVSTILAIGGLLGLFNLSEYVVWEEIPIHILTNDLTWWNVTALFFALVVPFIFLSILGFITITRKKLLNATIGWSLLGLWIMSIVVLSLSIPKIVSDFAFTSTLEEKQSWDMNDKTLVLKYNWIGGEFTDEVDLNIKMADDSLVSLEEDFTSKGRDRSRALENAAMVTYLVNQKDSVLIFDSHIRFNEDARFRFQNLDLTLFIPEGQKFIMDRELNNLLGNYLSRNDFSMSDIDDHVWYFEGGDLTCVDCIREEDLEEDRGQDETIYEESANDREYKFTDFEELEIHGDFKVDIERSSKYLVLLNGKKEELDQLVVEQRGDRLLIQKKGSDYVSSDDNIRIRLQLPEITDLRFTASSNVRIREFNVKNVKMFVDGSSSVDFDSNVERLIIDTEGSSQVVLFGKGQELEINSHDASKVNALDYYVDKVEVSSRGVSELKVFATDRISIISRDGSSVEYRGNAETKIEQKDDSRVDKR